MHHSHGDSIGLKYISWHAIIAGTIVALGLAFLFNLLTAGLNLSMYTRDEDGLQVLAWVGFAWVLIGSYIFLFLSGWVTGRLVHSSYSLQHCNGVLHGFMMWALTLIVSVVLLSHMTETTATLLSATFSALSIDTAANVVEGARTTGIIAIATFVLFLAGAIGACVGGYYGIGECQKCCEKKSDNISK